jgi:hypothetical protein
MGLITNNSTYRQGNYDIIIIDIGKIMATLVESVRITARKLKAIRLFMAIMINDSCPISL